MNAEPTAVGYPLKIVLLVLRIVLWVIWGGLLLGPFCFACVIALIFANPAPASPPPSAHDISVLLIVDILFGTILNSLVQAARFVVFRFASRNWVVLAVVYPFGKVIGWAAMEGVIYFSLVICLIARSFMPSLPVAIIAWLILVIDAPLFFPFKRYEKLRPTEITVNP